MKTKEIIEGAEVHIKWKFAEMIESETSDMGEWLLKGDGSDGNKYEGNITGTAKKPHKNNSGVVRNIRKMG